MIDPNTSNGNPPARQLLFVVGLPRSGTSLLYALLNQHPQIALMYEVDCLAMPGASLAAKFRSNWMARIEFWNGALSRHGFEITPELCREVGDARGLYLAYAVRKQASVYGEKSPNYGACLRRLAHSFPDARFIVIRRDFAGIYRSVLDASRHSAHFAKAGTLSRLIVKQERLIDDTLWLRAQRAALLTVDYRSLVAETGETARKICEFLDLPFDERMTRLDEADLSPVYNGTHHEHLRGREIRIRQAPVELDPKLAARIARWQNYWRRKEEGWDAGPPLLERWSCHSAGRLVFLWIATERIVYECLPLSVLRFYRTLKSCAVEEDGSMPESQTLASMMRARESRHRLLAAVWPALLSVLLIAICGLVHHLAGPTVSLAPFYLVAPAFATWFVGFRLGIPISLLTGTTWTIVMTKNDGSPLFTLLFCWNAIMRSSLLVLFILIFAQWLKRKGEEAADLPSLERQQSDEIAH